MELIEVSPKIEKQILVKCALDVKFRSKARSVLKEYLFSENTLVYIWKFIENAPRNDVITKESVETQLSIDFKHNEDKLEKHQLIVNEIYKQETNSSEINLDILKKAKNYTLVETAIVKAAESLSKGNLDEAWNFIDRLKKPKQDIGNRIDYIETFPTRIVEKIEKNDFWQKCIPTGIKLIDKVVDGLQFGELGIVAGTTGRGKSIIAVNLAFHAAVKGFSTVLFSTEMLAHQVANRFDARMTQVNYRRFKYGDFSEYELKQLMLKYRRRQKQLKNKLTIVDTPIRKCTLDFVEQTVLDLNDEGKNIKCIVIDSPDHFKSYGKYSEKRHELGEIFWNLKGISRGEGLIRYPLSVWATTQTPQQYENLIVGTRGVSDNYEKSRIGDLLLTLNQTKIQEQNDEMVVNLAKYRDGESRIMVLIGTDFKLMSFNEIDYYNENIKKDGLVNDKTNG